MASRRYGNRNGNGNGNGNGMDERHETSYPCEDMGPIASRGGATLAVSDNANIRNFEDDPAVFNDSPAARKSYSWNRGENGNGNGPR